MNLEVKRVALQCYGPTHYVWDGSRVEGRTAFREYLLKRKSENKYQSIVRVNHVVWERLTYDDRVKLLRCS